jgi:N-methylhydantoinase A/oxoprolinase/acetone carboxylase beta subunit
MDKSIRIGFDVGSTYTDGVMIKGKEILAKAKAITTEDVTTGIINALDMLLKSSGTGGAQIGMVSFGTTHTTNAIIERRGLNKVGIFRLGAPATTAIPPLTGWPEDLKEAIGGKQNIFIIRGGSEYDGRDIVPLDEEAIRKACKKLKGKANSIVITGVFSPMIPNHEERAAGIIREELGNIPITLSNHIASISLLERENSAILNASVISVMKRAINSLKEAAKERDIKAPLFIVQNDGTAMSANYAINYPIFTVASGPAASVRGAVFLSGVNNGVVVDIGGTSTDVAFIVNGFPRESSITVTIGGVKTNIRCPDLLSIALGGGTIVKTKGEEVMELGPESVGYSLLKLAKSYGGPIITTHDIAVAKGILNKRLDIFESDYATHVEKAKALDKTLIKGAYKLIKNRLEIAIDQMKTVAGGVKAVFIGGGAMVVPKLDLEGISEVIMPSHFEVGGAIGATIAEIGAYAEGVADLEIEERESAIRKVIEKAKKEAQAAGAIRNTIEILDVEEIPFTYMPGKREKIRVRVKGKIFE